MPKPLTLPTLKGELHLGGALEGDDNVLPTLKYPELKRQLWDSIASHKVEIESLVRRQLGVDWCHMSAMEVWQSGSFNVVIPIILAHDKAVHLRIPLPYRIGEDLCPGNVEEKLRSEIATYLWLEQHCPDVPIPRLHAFGLPDGSTFTHPSNTPFSERLVWNARRRLCRLLGRPVPIAHVRRRGLRHPLESGYLLLSEARGEMLVMSWNEHRHDKAFRQRLFRDLARITLSMNRIPLPRIASLSLDSEAVITLNNRPLRLYFQMYENEGIPSGIPRDRTYAAVEGYISDLLSLQNNKILHQPNSIHSTSDGQMQLAALTALRAVMHRFIKPEFREGPFYLTHTDLHGGNIFVDQDWNISTVIDLEWAQSMPIEMQLPPHWLTSLAVDGFETDEAVSEYDAVLKEYLDIYEAEERKMSGSTFQASVKREVWRNGGFWYFQSVFVPKGMYNIFDHHVQPLFNKDHPQQSVFEKVFFWYWGPDAQDVIERKLKDEESYMAKVKEAFGVTGEMRVSEMRDAEVASQSDSDLVVIAQEDMEKATYDTTSSGEDNIRVGVEQIINMAEVNSATDVVPPGCRTDEG